MPYQSYIPFLQIDSLAFLQKITNSFYISIIYHIIVLTGIADVTLLEILIQKIIFTVPVPYHTIPYGTVKYYYETIMYDTSNSFSNVYLRT